MTRTARIAALTVAVLAAGSAVPALAVGLTAPTSTRLVCAGSRLVEIIACVDDEALRPVPQLPGTVPDPRPLPIP